MTPNEEALARFAAGDALFAGVAPAREVVAVLSGGAIALTHAGPPISFDRMCGPMRGALTGAVLFEGWASSPAAAVEMLESGAIALHPNHETGSVAPMAGVISPSMQAVVVENPAFGVRVATVLNEGNVPDSLRCGAHAPAVIERLRWLNGPVAAELAASLPAGLSLRDLLAQALLMGDELHQQNLASTSLLLRALLPRLRQTASASQVVRYMLEASQCGLNFAMAASKALLDPLAGIPGCTIVTAMSRNGVEFGIRVSGAGGRWFTAPAPMPQGVWWEGFGPADANPDIGDSAIVETAGLGGFALPGAPALHARVGWTPAAAAAAQSDLRRITSGESPFFAAAPDAARGTPSLVDCARVAGTGISPLITTGIAHASPGRGQVGVGTVRAPIACFTAAAAAIAPASITN